MSFELNDGCKEKFRNMELRVGEQEEKVARLEGLANKFYGGFAVCGIIWAISEIILKLHGRL